MTIIDVPASPLPTIRRSLALSLGIVVLFVFVLGTWSVLAPLESAAVASGVVEVQSHRKTIQHLEGGIIGAILVHDGDSVEPGQPLLRLDDTKARTSLSSLEGQLWDAYARRARLIAERDGRDAVGFPPELEKRAADSALGLAMAGQQKIFHARRDLLESKIGLVRQRIKETLEEIEGLRAQETANARRSALIQEELRDAQHLMDRGLERKPRMLQLARDAAELEGSRGQIRAQIARAQQTIAESELNVLSLRNDNQNEVAQQLRETEEKLHELVQQREAAADVLARSEIRAPERGVVTDLRVHTAGGVVTPGEALLDLVPQQDEPIVKAQVRPEDLDLVRIGLPAMVRLLPYKQRRTPPVEGIVTYVSADRILDQRTNQPYYEARIRLSQSRLAALPGVEVVPGMPTEVMIKTGKTTVALYALSPILDSFNRAFVEK
jgi:HlyD family secretion protein